MNNSAPEGKLYGYVSCPTCGVFLHKDKELHNQRYCWLGPQCPINSEAEEPPEPKEIEDEPA